VHLTNAQFDRAAGVLLGAGVASALAGSDVPAPWVARAAHAGLKHLADADALVAELTREGRSPVEAREEQARTLLSLAIGTAVIEGSFDLRGAVARLAPPLRHRWSQEIDQAELGDSPPALGHATDPGAPLLSAWRAVVRSETPAGPFECRHLRNALAGAVRTPGGDGTTASIVGALLGARWGASAVPAEWRRLLDVATGRRTSLELEGRAYIHVRGGHLSDDDWPLVERLDYGASQIGSPTRVRHPHDEGVWLGAAPVLDRLPADVTAVVSLCPVGRSQVPLGVVHVGFRLLDNALPRNNPHLDFVIDDAARTVQALREEGHTVLVHCVAAHSRTPTVAIRYAHLRGIEPDLAYRSVVSAMPHAYPNPGFRAALDRLAHGAPAIDGQLDAATRSARQPRGSLDSEGRSA
jgi:ADP-ribosyl-[dinitrogen reductase] hydrolase